MRSIIRSRQSLLPYSERYHFVDMEQCDFSDPAALYVLHRNDLSYMDSPYTILLENDSFITLILQ